MRTSTFKKRTLVAYEVDESSSELVVNILGVFHSFVTEAEIMESAREYAQQLNGR